MRFLKPSSKKFYLLIRLVSVLYGLALLYILFLRSIGATYYMIYTEYLAAASNFIAWQL